MEELLKIAINEIGTQEIEGIENNPEILKYASECGINWIADDETPWCSTFVNWCALKAGLPKSGKANARSWLSVGKKTYDPEPGDIVVFWRESKESAKGHVAIFFGFNSEKSRVFVLGGNQGNRVSISSYSVDQVLSYQKLIESNSIVIPEPVLKKGDRGKKVIQLQNALKAINIEVGTSDGIFGDKTEQGVKELQTREHNTSIDGIYGTATKNLLTSILQQ